MFFSGYFVDARRESIWSSYNERMFQTSGGQVFENKFRDSKDKYVNGAISFNRCEDEPDYNFFQVDSKFSNAFGERTNNFEAKSSQHDRLAIT